MLPRGQHSRRKSASGSSAKESGTRKSGRMAKGVVEKA